MATLTANRPIPFFPAADELSAVLACSGRLAQIMAYTHNARAVLWDGTMVRPTLRTAKTQIDCMRSGLSFPVVCQTDITVFPNGTETRVSNYIAEQM